MAPPGDGLVLVLLPVRAADSGPESMLRWIDLEVTFLADSGRSYEHLRRHPGLR